MSKAFDNRKYLRLEKRAVLSRLNHFDKLYLELGGHLLYDAHASRVLPGYNPENKLKLIKSFGKKACVVYCISSESIQRAIPWADSGLLLEELAVKEVSLLRKKGLTVSAFVLTFFSGQSRAVKFAESLAKAGEVVVFTSKIKNYPHDLKSVFGKKGFASQPLLNLSEKIIAVSGAGANNGKMFFCLSQLFWMNKLKINTGFAKVETFPIWNLPVNHEVNLAYEAATADIKDRVKIDPFHKKAYSKNSVNYNRDIENFPVLKRIISRIAPKKSFMHSCRSPTDMGINMAGFSITNDALVRKASRKEIFRRLTGFKKKLAKKETDVSTIARLEEIILSLD